MKTNDEFDRGQSDVLSFQKVRCEESLVVFWDSGFRVLSLVAGLPSGAELSIIFK